MPCIIRYETEIDLGVESRQLDTTEKWNLLNVLMRDLETEGSSEDWEHERRQREEGCP